MARLILHDGGRPADLCHRSLRRVTLLPFLVLMFLNVAVEVRADFGYSGSEGPSHWGEKYDTCVGKHQSPINIEEHDVENVTLPLLSFYGLKFPRDLLLINNGHTVMLQTNSSEQAYIEGGPLNSSYIFMQLHFHWGQNDREGSEDLINNHSFAMEMHAVFYNNHYQSLLEATSHPDGLAVLSFFFEADPNNKAHPNFHAIVELLPNIERQGSKIKLADSYHLKDLLNPNFSSDSLQNYYTYIGSLTTPPCSEVVTWIDFKQPLYLSHSQIAAFRNIRGSEGEKLTHNFRPVQPLADRKVYSNSHFFPLKCTNSKCTNSSNAHDLISIKILFCIAYVVSYLSRNQR